MDATILQALESIRCGLLNVVACICTFFGEEVFLVALVAAFYYAIDKKRGRLLAMSVFTAATVNGALKDLVRRPRPYKAGVVSRVDVDNFLVSTKDLDGSYSFPSGHSMNAGAAYTTLSVTTKKKGRIAIFVTLLVLVMLSRLYLGVHYPTDVLAGAAVGILCAVLYAAVQERSEKAALWVFFGMAVFMTLPLLYAESADSFKAAGGMLGAAVGFLIEDRFVNFAPPEKAWKGLLRVVLGVAVLLGLRFLLKAVFPAHNLFQTLRYFLTISAGVCGVPALFKPLKL